jgi:hypothetical protein
VIAVILKISLLKGTFKGLLKNYAVSDRMINEIWNEIEKTIQVKKIVLYFTAP